VSKSKEIRHGDDAIERVKIGVDTLANTVKVTLGPKGKHVALQNVFSGIPVVTKDGVSVAREITLKDEFENVGAQLVKEVAQRTADLAGDGTTTATLLTQSIITEGLRATKAGANAVFVKKGIEAATDKVIKSLKELSVEVDDEKLKSVATISANNDTVLGELIASSMIEAGVDGVITVEESKTFETYSEGVAGMELARGFISPYFINNDKLTCELDNCRILITDRKISNHAVLIPILEKCAKEGAPLVIIGADVDGTALSVMIANHIQGRVKSCAIKAPGFGDNRNELLEDIAAATGGRVISEVLNMDIEHVTIGDLGSAEKIIVNKDSTTIINGRGDQAQIDKRIAITKQSISNSSSDFDKEKAQERLAKLTGGVIVLYIGAPTETEIKEKKARVEDALHATRAAVEEGIVPGGGIAYLHAIKSLENLDSPENNADDFKIGVKLLKTALMSPLYQICTNAGLNGEVIYHEINRKILENSNSKIGYNIVTDTYGDMIAQGVIDPTKVAINALRNAASVAGIILTLEAVVVEKKDDNTNTNTPLMPAVPQMGGMNMPGMM